MGIDSNWSKLLKTLAKLRLKNHQKMTIFDQSESQKNHATPLQKIKKICQKINFP